MTWNHNLLLFKMNFINKLNDTYGLLNNLDDILISGTRKDLIKKQLLSISEDLARYKDLDERNIIFENEEIKSKMTDILNRINEIEIGVKNKLIITEKYNTYLNS